MASVKQVYPRSFLRLILLGNIFVALPLLAAIAYGAISIERLTENSQQMVRDASLAARLGNRLPEDLAALDRVLRQYEVLNDPSLLDDYALMRSDWRRGVQQYAEIPLLGVLSDRLQGILADEASTDDAFRNKALTAADLRQTLADLRARSRQAVVEGAAVVDREVNQFRAQAAELRRRLFLAQAVGLLAMILFMGFGREVLTRVFNRFERAVMTLGEGKLDQEINIEGPADMRRMGRRLDWLRQRLLALEEQRTFVLRHVSHELKTPLAALREGSSLLTEGAAGPLTGAQAKIVGIMRNNSLRLQTLIDGLLKLQQAGYAGSAMEAVPMRFDELVQQVVATHQLAARNKRLTFAGTLAPLTVSGGQEELTTVVDNLVSNAIKYSPEGGTVTLNLVRRDRFAVLEVADQGAGVPESDRQKIFEPFFRSAESRQIAGVGLGLAIAKEFTAAHDGKLELTEESGGAHFRVSLPIKGKKK
jgi:two-component system, NtrC family, sensor histidine kinase GlrK